MTLFDVIDWYSNFYECRMLLYGKEYGIHPICQFSWLLFVVYCPMYYSFVAFLRFPMMLFQFLSVMFRAYPWAYVKRRLENGVLSVCGAQSL